MTVRSIGKGNNKIPNNTTVPRQTEKSGLSFVGYPAWPAIEDKETMFR
jgi:hypothetical protein